MRDQPGSAGTSARPPGQAPDQAPDRAPARPETELRDGRNWFVRATHLTGRTIMGSMTRVRLVDADRDALHVDGPLIVASNHLSNADPVLIGSWLSPILGRNLHWLGKEEAMRWPLLGWAMRQNGVFGVRRGAADVDAFRLAKRVLDEGFVLVVFPEGTRSSTGGLQEAKDGLAILALRTGSSILPVGISGTDRFWPRGGKPRLGGSVTMRVGRPFQLTPIPRGADRRAAQHAATLEIMERIAALLAPRHRGVYGGSSGGAAASIGDERIGEAAAIEPGSGTEASAAASGATGSTTRGPTAG
jgi:1-acyl-sn-glycerol-3-phosphate acyltransferase